MRITKLKLTNYKSIKSAEIFFNNKSIILGANASGKSNLISALKFINYILAYGLEDAISLMGGIENIINFNAEPDSFVKFSFSLDLSNKTLPRFRIIEEAVPIKIDYHFSLSKKKNGAYKIEKDEIYATMQIFEKQKNKKSIESNDKLNYLGNILVKYSKKDGSFNYSIIENNTSINKDILQKESFFDMFSAIMRADKNELMLNNIRFLFPVIVINANEIFKVYDFDPKLLKTPSQIISKRNLEEDGSNIGVVLERLLKDKEDKDKLLGLLKFCLPSIQSIEIKKNIDKSVSYQMLETYFKKPLYSQFLSDGTVSMLALVIALYFNNEDNIVILEEPERNLHPKVISKLFDMINDVSKNKQIIITTHNSEFIKCSELKDIICIKRNKAGETIITHPNNDNYIKNFLDNELGIDELFLNGIL